MSNRWQLYEMNDGTKFHLWPQFGKMSDGVLTGRLKQPKCGRWELMRWELKGLRRQHRHSPRVDQMREQLKEWELLLETFWEFLGMS